MDNQQLNDVFNNLEAHIPPSPKREAIRQQFLTDASQLTITSPNPPPRRRKITVKIRQLLLVASLFAILLIASVVIAQQIIQIFNPVEKDQHPIPVSVGTAGRQPVNLPISLTDAIDQVDFTISIPDDVPNAYTLKDIFYWEGENRLSIHYQCGSYRQLILTQMPMTTEEFANLQNQNIGVLDVGASALIEPIEVNDSIGQYVRGTWIVKDNAYIENISGTWIRTLEDHQTGQTITVVPGTPIPARSVWENNSELQRLYWFDDDMFYILSNIGSRIDVGTAGACSLDKTIYATVANSLSIITR